jgi:hypothetical protein
MTGFKTISQSLQKLRQKSQAWHNSCYIESQGRQRHKRPIGFAMAGTDEGRNTGRSLGRWLWLLGLVVGVLGGAAVAVAFTTLMVPPAKAE